ncbi:hypothetical protein [Palleronia abyssalis]|nr:hypothetical protein [Palleronia abyssalis]
MIDPSNGGGSEFRYHCYGFDVISEMALPELAACHGSRVAGAVLDIRRDLLCLPPEIRALPVWSEFTEEGSFFWWGTVGGFHVDAQGHSIRIEVADGVSDDMAAFPLLGPVLSEVLRRRGFFVLHASAVEIDGVAVAFLADKGVGKSTTGAALLDQGARIVADDLVAIDPVTAVTQPGFAQLKLSPHNLPPRATRDDWVVRPQPHPAIDKARVMVSDTLLSAAVPVRRLYVLERGPITIPRIEPVDVDRALPELLKFAYAARFGEKLLKGPAAARHFRSAVSLTTATSLRRLVVPDGMEHLQDLLNVLRGDLFDDLGGCE